MLPIFPRLKQAFGVSMKTASYLTLLSKYIMQTKYKCLLLIFHSMKIGLNFTKYWIGNVVVSLIKLPVHVS